MNLKSRRFFFNMKGFRILNLLAPVDRSLPTTGQVELLQAKGGPWLAGQTRSLPLHFGQRTCDNQNFSQFHLGIYDPDHLLTLQFSGTGIASRIRLCFMAHCSLWPERHPDVGTLRLHNKMHIW